MSVHFFHQGELIKFVFFGFFSLYFRYFAPFLVVFESSLLIFWCRIVLQLSSICLDFFHQGMPIDFAFLAVFSLYFRFFCSFFVIFESSLLIFLCRTVLQLPSISLDFFNHGMHIHFPFLGVFCLYFRFFEFFLPLLLVCFTVLC